MSSAADAAARDRFLLVTVGTAGRSSTLRVYVWRKLRAIGAVYVHKSSVAVLPSRDETARGVNRLASRVRHDGGQMSVWAIELSDPAQERELIGMFQAERASEYAEVCARTPAFLAGLDQQRAKGRITYAEVEESEANLERLRKWLSRIQSRDYFAAAGAGEAIAAVEACREALVRFEAEMLAAEAPDGEVTARAAQARTRLRAVEGGARR